MRRPAHPTECSCQCHREAEGDCLVCRSLRLLLAERVRESFPPARSCCAECGASLSAPATPCLRLFRGMRSTRDGLPRHWRLGESTRMPSGFVHVLG